MEFRRRRVLRRAACLVVVEGGLADSGVLKLGRLCRVWHA